jgi:hypothetical protein
MHPLGSLLLLSASFVPAPVKEVARPSLPGKVVIIRETRSRGEGDARSIVPENALAYVKSGRAKVVAMARAPVSTPEHGLDLLGKSLQHTITAAAEVDGWFFYDINHVSEDEHGRPMPLFISGYAVQRGSQKVVEYSVW